MTTTPQIPKPSILTPTLPPTTSQTQRYSDAEEWRKAYDAKITKLNNLPAVKWQPDLDVLSIATKVWLTIGYRKKETAKESLSNTKAHCSVRGDKLKPHENFESDSISDYMAEQAAVGLIFPLCTPTKAPIEHFDITTA